MIDKDKVLRLKSMVLSTVFTNFHSISSFLKENYSHKMGTFDYAQKPMLRCM